MALCQGLDFAAIFQIAVSLVALLLLLALVTAVRRGDGVIRGIGAQERGKRSSPETVALAQAAVPVILLGVEVLQLWDMLRSSTASTGPHLWVMVEVFDHCIFDHHAVTNGDSLLLAWMVPYVVVVLLLIIAVGRTVFVEVLRHIILPSLTESARASSAVGPPRETNIIRIIFTGMNDACCDAVAASVVALLAMHTRIMQVTFRGISCCFNPDRCDLSGGVALWAPLACFAVLLNIVIPTCGLVKLVMWRNSQIATQLRPIPLHRRRRTLLLTTSLIPCEPWLPWQLLGNILVVAGFELVFAWDANERARWLALAFVQIVFFFQLMVLIWPRWLLDAPLLRFNVALRVSLLTVVCFHSIGGDYSDSDIAWPLRMLIIFVIIRTLLAFYDDWGARVMRLGVASLRKCSWKGEDTTSDAVEPEPGAKVHATPLFGLARDLSQVSLFFVLTEPTKFPTFCEDLSTDERACLMSASQLVTSRLLTARGPDGRPLSHGADVFMQHQHHVDTLFPCPILSDGSTEAEVHRSPLPSPIPSEGSTDAELRRSTVDLMSAAISQDILHYRPHTCASDQSGGSFDVRSKEEKRDWVAPLPLLESDRDDRSTTGRRMSGKDKMDPMLTKKWLLDHFIPAANGPDFMDGIPLGHSSATSNTSCENAISSSSPPRPRPRWCSGDNISMRHTVHSTSAEEFLKGNSETASDIVSINSSRTRPFKSLCAIKTKTSFEFSTPGTVPDPSDLSPKERERRVAEMERQQGKERMDVEIQSTREKEMREAEEEEKIIGERPHLETTASVNRSNEAECSSRVVADSYSIYTVPPMDAPYPVSETSPGIVNANSWHKQRSPNSSGSDVSQTSKGSERWRPVLSSNPSSDESRSNSDKGDEKEQSARSKQGDVDSASNSDVSSNGSASKVELAPIGPLDTTVNQQGGSSKRFSNHRVPKLNAEELVPTIESVCATSINNPPPARKNDVDLIASKDVVNTNLLSEMPMASRIRPHSPETSPCSISTATSSHKSNGQRKLTSPMLPEAYRDLLAVAPSSSLLQLFNERFIKPSKIKRQAAPTMAPGAITTAAPLAQASPPESSHLSCQPTFAVEKLTTANVNLDLMVSDPLVIAPVSTVSPIVSTVSPSTSSTTGESQLGVAVLLPTGEDESEVDGTNREEKGCTENCEIERRLFRTDSGNGSNRSIKSPMSTASSRDTVRTRELLQLAQAHTADERLTRTWSSTVLEEPESKEREPKRGSCSSTDTRTSKTKVFSDDDYAEAQDRLKAALARANSTMSGCSGSQGAYPNVISKPAVDVVYDEPTRQLSNLSVETAPMEESSPSSPLAQATTRRCTLGEALVQDDSDSPEKWSAWKARKETKRVNASRAKYGDWLRGMADSYGGMGATARLNG